MDVYMYTDVYIFFWNYGFLQVYVYACVYMEHIYMIIIHVCVYIDIHTHTHTHTQWNVYSAIKRNKIV